MTTLRPRLPSGSPSRPAATDRKRRTDGRSREGGGSCWRPCARVRSFQSARQTPFKCRAPGRSEFVLFLGATPSTRARPAPLESTRVRRVPESRRRSPFSGHSSGAKITRWVHTDAFLATRAALCRLVHPRIVPQVEHVLQ